MLNVFTLVNGRLVQEEFDGLPAAAGLQPVWSALESPTPAEVDWVRQSFELTIPSDAVDDDLEESARFYEEDNGELHIRSDFLVDASDGGERGADKPEPARNVRVAFILYRNVLFSVHAEDLPVFRLLRLRIMKLTARRVSITLRRMRPFRSSSLAMADSAALAAWSLTPCFSTLALTASRLS